MMKVASIVFILIFLISCSDSNISENKEIAVDEGSDSNVRVPNPSAKFCVDKIDVSRAFADSYGKREIILSLHDKVTIKKSNKEVTLIFPKVLRLNCKEYAKQIGNFIGLNQKMQALHFYCK